MMKVYEAFRDERAMTSSQQGLEAEAATWASKARGLLVTDTQSYVNASHLLTSVKHFRAAIAKFFAPHIAAAMETKRKAEAARKALVDEQARMEGPLVEAEGSLKRSLLSWDATQEQRRTEEERRLQAEARQRAEAVTLEAAAALEAEAIATGDAAILQEAHDILEQPMDTPVVVVKKAMPKVEGVTYRDNWKAADVVDVKALAAAVAAGTVPTTFLLPNMTALNQFARATKGTQVIPGVKVWNDRQIAARPTA
jgi:hypothetical protein